MADRSPAASPLISRSIVGRREQARKADRMIADAIVAGPGRSYEDGCPPEQVEAVP
jgi:hypothetical protein